MTKELSDENNSDIGKENDYIEYVLFKWEDVLVKLKCIKFLFWIIFLIFTFFSRFDSILPKKKVK